MAKTASPLSSISLVPLPGEDPELATSRQKYIDAQQAMLDALQARNEFIDPRYLAMSRAFLQPTKSGRFGESLGNVMEAYGTADEAERKRNIEMAQIRAELAASQYGAAQKGEALKAFTGAMQPGKTSQTITADGQQYPAEFVGMTPQRAAQIGMYDKDLGELANKFLQAMRDEVKVTAEGAYNVRTGQFTPAPGGTLLNVYVPELGGDLPMTREDQVELSRARRQGDGKAIRQIINRITQATTEAAPEAPSPAPTPGATAAEGPSAKPALTLQERERQKKEEEAKLETRTAAEKKLAESAAGRTSQVFEQASAARQTDPTYARIETILKEPGIDTVMGVLERNGALAQLGSLVEEAIRVGNYSIGIPTIRKVLTNAGTPQNLIDRAMELTSAFAQLNFDARKGLGSGTSVSNFEQMMVNQMGLSMMDTAASAKAKLAFLREQAKFRQQVGSALKEARKKSPGLQYDDFEETPEFINELFNPYKARQEANVKRAGQPETPRGEVIQPRKPAAQRAGPGQERKIDNKTYVRQPDGSYKLKE